MFIHAVDLPFATLDAPAELAVMISRFSSPA
jgi:hypothetical protein